VRGKRNVGHNGSAQLKIIQQSKQELLRKVFRLHNDKIRWWHVVSGDKGDLEKLEREWEAVKTET